MPLSIPDVNLNKLIDEQTKFIKGIAPTRFSSTPLTLSSNFAPTQRQAIASGFRSNTDPIKQSARSVSDDVLQNTFNSIDERLAAKGLTGSSAQSQQLVRAGQESANSLADLFANLDFNADESAANRRGQALDRDIQRAAAGTAQFGADTARGSADLAGRTQQAGAGQDLLDSLLRALPTSMASQSRASAPAPRQSAVPRSVNTGVALPRPLAPVTSHRASVPMSNMRRKSSFNSGFSLPMLGPNGFDLNNSHHNNLVRQNRNILNFGQDNAAALEQALMGATAQMFSSGNSATPGILQALRSMGMG